MEECPFRGNNRTERLPFGDIFFQRNFDFIEAVIIELWKPQIIPLLPPKSAWVWWQVYIGAVDAKILLRKIYLINLYLLLLFKFIFVITIHFVNFCKMISNLQYMFSSPVLFWKRRLWTFLALYLPTIRRSFLPFLWEKRTPDCRLVCYDFFNERIAKITDKNRHKAK